MMKKLLKIFKHKAIENRWALLSGVLVGTSYIPWPPWALIFCYAPLWIFTTKKEMSVRTAITAAWVTQFTLTLIGFHWIALTAHDFGQFPWPLALVALLLFAGLMHLYIPAAVGLGTWFKKKWNLTQNQTIFVIALLHSLLERVWPVIFDWHLGYTLLWAKIPAYNLADVMGFHGLSTLILLLNAWVAILWLQRHLKQRLIIQLCLLAFTVAAFNLWGFFQNKYWQIFDKQVKATVVQANIGNLEKVYAEQGRGYQEFIAKKFVSLTQSASEKFPDTDIFVWPETAFPDFLDPQFIDRPHTQILTQGMSAVKKPLLTGAYSKDLSLNPLSDRSTYNALFLVDFDGRNLDQPYRKTELLAFGEYLPLSERFPILLKMLPFISNFGRGQGPETMDWNFQNDRIRWGGQICYEGLYPAFSRGLAEKGSDIIVNVTNDSWFGTSAEPFQHLYMTLARAIEIRRPLLRSTNTGISTAILANGEISQQSPIHQEWSGQFVINFLKNAPTTFYVRWGHWDWIAWTMILFFILVSGARHARSRSTRLD